MGTRLRVLVADDSALMRILIKEILELSREIDVICAVSNGNEAFEKTLELSPDVVLLDMNMGDYDGLYAVKKIMQNKPTPAVILSAMGNDDMDPIMAALEAGAVDYLNKPARNATNLHLISEEIVSKVKAAAASNVAVPLSLKKVQAPHTFSGSLAYDIVVIGSSTGGPPAIEEILFKLPENFAVPVIIVQHMPAGFVPSFAQRLNQHCSLEVVMAKKGDLVKPGKVLVAPGSRNMVLRRSESGETEVDFTSRTYKEYNYPSVNSVMESAAQIYGERCIGVILTGMGKDGTEGMKKIFEKGGYTIAQDKATSVVFGMPKEAIESGCVRQVVPINEIGFFLVSCIS